MLFNNDEVKEIDFELRKPTYMQRTFPLRNFMFYS